MQVSLEIRTAKIADASSISELVRNVAQSCLGADATPFLNTVSPATIEGYIQNPIYSYVLGFLDNELVGIAAMREKKHFYHLFVSPKHHCKGIAKSLWHHLKSDSVSNGINLFTVNSSIYAVSIYKKFGFSPTSEPQTINGINYVPMQLSVSG
ncbi:MAG: GNAT family N-acetyltransferase [Gallionellaceae bacterium]|jgi:ribosomal protein S18 acetylase RimI-like enzyme